MALKRIKSNSILKFLIKNEKKGESIGLDSLRKISKIGILVNYDLLETYDFTKKLSENLGVDKNDFEIVLFHDSKKKKVEEQYLSFSENSFGFYGKIKDEKLKKFVSEKFDLLINYCAVENDYAQLLSFHSNAKIKMGFKNEIFNFYNLSIKLEGNKIDTFNEEITKYLNILKLL